MLVVRSGSDPLALTAPEATNEIDQCTSASTAYPPEPQFASTYGFRPASPGRQRVSYRCRTASAGGGPAVYGRPGPPTSDAPSPKRHSTLGSALTLTLSPRNEIDSTSRRGGGASQNHESAPVKPPRAAAGLASIRPGASSNRAASAAAIAAGLIAGPAVVPPRGFVTV